LNVTKGISILAKNNSIAAPRGFASMDKNTQRELASKGGRIAHENGNAHTFSPDEAREAGRKGGNRTSRDREHMAEIGRKGGKATRSPNHTASDDHDDIAADHNP
jgi:general stress protein YciG